MGRVRIISVEVELLEVIPADDAPVQQLNDYHNKEEQV